MRIYAHRGDHRSATENTMKAFMAAEENGAHGIETDLRHTRDGEVVLFHDHAAAGAPVADLSLRELEDLVGHDVPTLWEVASRPWACGWNLEIKTTAAYALARPIIATWQGDLLVTSFLHDVVERAARETRRQCGALIAHRPAWNAMPLPPPGVTTLVWDWKVIDAEMLRQAYIAGWDNAAYGAVGLEEHHAAKRLGLSMLITDHVAYGLESIRHPS